MPECDNSHKSNREFSSAVNLPATLRIQPSNSKSSTGSTKTLTITIDTLRMDELRSAIGVLSSYFPPEEVPNITQLTTRFERAHQLTIGAFVSLPPHMVAGPLSGSGESRRRMIGVISATVAPAHVTQSMCGHSNSPLARVVCIQDFGIEQGNRHQGVGSHLIRTFLCRLQTLNMSNKAHGQEYEIVSVVCPKKRKSFFEQFGFTFHSFSYESRASDVWFEMRRPIHKDVNLCLDTSFAQEDWADQHSALSASIGSPPALPELGPVAEAPTLESSETPTEQRTTSPSGEMARSSIFTMSPLSPEPASYSPYGMSPIDVGQPATSIGTDSSLTALLQKASLSDGAARDLGIIPASAPQKPKKNPGKALEAIFGEALASKTFSEDFRTAVKSRIVDLKYHLNLHGLMCPNEACDCKLVARESAEWTVRETGPLLDTVPSVNGEIPSATSKGMDMQNAPWLNTLFQSPSLDGWATIGPVRGFWRLPNPMGFDNVTFSRTVEWVVPNRTMQPLHPQESRSSVSSSGHQASTSQPAQQKRSGRGSFSSSLRQTLQKQDVSPQEVSQTSVLEARDDSQWDVTPGEKRLVKYIMCPDCGCGPLGFTLLPRTASQETQPSNVQNNDCYVAAFRVRYV